VGRVRAISAIDRRWLLAGFVLGMEVERELRRKA
jgi:hypothetical protein